MCKGGVTGRHPGRNRLTPDPAGPAAVDLTNPQSLNRYAYVMNNPTTLIDPSGLGPCVPGAPNYENDCQPPPPSGGPPPTDPSFWAENPGYGFDFPMRLEDDELGIFKCHSWAQCLAMAGGDGVPPASTSSEAANNGLTPQQAATQYCQQHGQLSFNIPFTKIPVTISLSATLGPANYGATNDINAVVPVIPWPEWLAAGASVDITVNAPAEPSSNPNVGLGKNLSVGYFTTSNGPQGLSLSVGPSMGPPINVSVPANNACGMVVGGKG